MAASTEHLEDPELLQTEWDLSPLVDGDEQAGVDRLLDEATERAEAFSAAYAGKMTELDADGLAQAMHDLETINEVVGKAGSYASLRFSHRHRRPERRALLQRMHERATAIETKLLFFELEWAALEDAAAEALLSADGLEFARHHLRSARRHRPHLLSSPRRRSSPRSRFRARVRGLGCSVN